MGGFQTPRFRSGALAGFGTPSAPSVPSSRPSAFRSRTLDMLGGVPEEPEEEGFVSKAKNVLHDIAGVPAHETVSKWLGVDPAIGKTVADTLSNSPAVKLNPLAPFGFVGKAILDRALPEKVSSLYSPLGSGAVEETVNSTVLDVATAPLVGRALSPGASLVDRAASAGVGTEGLLQLHKAVSTGDWGNVPSALLRTAFGAFGAASRNAPAATKAAPEPSRLARAVEAQSSEPARLEDFLSQIRDEPLNLTESQLLDVWPGETPRGFEPPTAPIPDRPVDILAERDFLRPDPAAMTDAEQARLGRKFREETFISPEADAFGRAVRGAITTPEAPRLAEPGFRLSTDARTVAEGRRLPRWEVARETPPPITALSPFVRPDGPVDAPAGILGDPNDPFVDPPVWNARYPNVLPDRTVGRVRVKSETPENYPIREPGLLLPDGQRAMPTIHGPLIDDTQPFQRNPELEARQAEAMGANPEAAQAFVESAEGAAEAAARRMARKRGGPNAYEPPIRPTPLDEGIVPAAEFAPPTGDPRLQNPNSMLARAAKASEGFPTEERSLPPTGTDGPVREQTRQIQTDEPQFAYRARDVGEQGVAVRPDDHAHASTSEEDIRRVAPSRSERPQEVVRVDLSKMDHADYEVIPRQAGEAPWVKFRRELPETNVERVGEITDVDRAAADKATPQVAETIALSDTADLAQASGLSMEQAAKGAADVRADGVRELSPEAVALKRMVLSGEAPAVEVRAKARTVETPDPNARWEAGEKNAAPLTGRWNLANPHEALAEVVPTVARASQRLMDPLDQVVRAASQMAGETVNLKGLTLDSNLQAAVRGKDMRVGIMSAVEQATRKYEARLQAGQYEGLNPQQRAKMFSREVARHIVNPVSHEIAHAKADRMARTDKRYAKTLDQGGHGPGYVQALREVYQRMSKGRNMLRRHIEEALDAQGGQLRDSLQQAWAEVQPLWGRLDAERAGGGRGVSTGDGGSLPVGAGRGLGEGPSGSSGVRAGRVESSSGVRESPRGSGEAPGLASGSGVRGGRAPIKPIPDKGNVTAHPEAPKPFTDKPAGFWDKMREWWKAGLVSGPGTQVANAASAGGETAVRAVEAGLAGMVDRMMGGTRTRFSGEALEQIKGSVSRAPAAFNAVSEGLKTVLSSEGAIGGKAGGIIRGPLQLLGVVDSGTAELAGGAALRGRAFRQAKAELPNGSRAQITDRTYEIMRDPSESLKADVEKEVRNRQYRDAADDPESIVSSIKTLREKHKWLHGLLPFLETPGAIVKLTIERSPIGFVKGFKAYAKYKRALKAGLSESEILKFKGEAADELAKPLAGTLALGMFWLYAKSGGMTGSGPTDPREKALLRETGWQPYSFKVGVGKDSYYVPYNRFEPVSSFLGFAADIAESKDTKTAGEAVEKGIGSVVSNLTSKTYLQGLADAAEFINDPKRHAGPYLANLAGSAVPNVVKKVAQAIDPIQRDTRPQSTGFPGIPERIAKTVASGIPGLSKTLPERRAVTGETVERPGNAATRLLSPIQPTKERAGRDLEGLMVELGVSQGAPQRQVTIPKTGVKVQLSQSEYGYLRDVDKKATEFLRRQTNDPRFKRLPQDQQKAYIERVYRSAGDEGRKKVLSRPEFRQRARSAVSESRA